MNPNLIPQKEREKRKEKGTKKKKIPEKNDPLPAVFLSSP